MEFQRWNVLCSSCKICIFISAMINNACLTCTDTFLFYIYISSWILLIRWKTTTLPLGDDAAHLCVSVIYGSGFDSECVSHLKPVLKPHPHQMMRRYSSRAADGCSAPLSRYELGTDEPSRSDKVICSPNRREIKYIYEGKGINCKYNKKNNNKKILLICVLDLADLYLAFSDWFF